MRFETHLRQCKCNLLPVRGIGEVDTKKNPHRIVH